MHNPLPRLAIAAGTAPIVAINLIYLLAAAEGNVPWCVPYWDSCTSISATGRHGMAFWLFKAVMLPQAVLYAAYWRRAGVALNEAGADGRSVARIGMVAVAALVLYVLCLGLVGNAFELSRRIGVILYFSLTYLCQLLVVYRLRAIDPARPGLTAQLALCAIILGTGLLTLVLDLTMTNYDDVEDAFEWVIALLLHVNFVLAARSWRRGAGRLAPPAA